MKGSNQPLGLFCYDLDLSAARAAAEALAASQGVAGSTSLGNAGVPGADSSTATSGLVPQAVRNSLARLPGAAVAARSSVVVAGGHSTSANELQGVDPAEVRGGLSHTLAH